LHLDSGHVIYKNDGLHLIADVGRAGPDYLMAHAHADTLSFEFEWKGQRIIVNSGTSLYEAGPERHRQRSTPAHSTVTLNGENSSEVWSSFRVARRAYPFGLELTQDTPDTCHIRCSHDGYRRLKGKPVHQRTWDILHNTLTVEDRVLGPFHQATARFHLHPDLKPSWEENLVVLRKDEQVIASCRVIQESVSVRPTICKSTYHPAFGVSLDNSCLEYEVPFSGILTTQFTFL
jgi:uncharacterized heparinase superfamily protein